jgi:hypothetical protein
MIVLGVAWLAGSLGFLVGAWWARSTDDGRAARELAHALAQQRQQAELNQRAARLSFAVRTLRAAQRN